MIIEISTVAELQAIQNDLSADYVLVNDIDASLAEGFIPIGGTFLGTFDGNNFAISNLAITTVDRNTGLFNALGSTGVIRRLRLLDIDFKTTAAGTSVNLGGFAGQTNTGSLIEDCRVTGAVEATGDNRWNGLIAGAVSGTVRRVEAHGSAVSGGRGYGIGNGRNGATYEDVFARGFIPAGGSTNRRAGFTGEAPASYIATRVGVAVVMPGSGSPFAATVDAAAQFVDCLYDADIANGGANVTAAVAKTTAEMKSLASYQAAGWDIVAGVDPTRVWGIDSAINDGYPFLQSLYQASATGPTITNVPNMTQGVEATITGTGFGATAGTLEHGATAEGPWTTHAVDTWGEMAIVITPNLPASGEYYWRIITDDFEEVVGGPNTVTNLILASLNLNQLLTLEPSASVLLSASLNLNQLSTLEPSSSVVSPGTIVATGGTITNINVGGVDYKVHTFTAGGTFEVISGQDTVEYLIVAGGGGSGGRVSGGGGGGGVIFSSQETSQGVYNVVVGQGGAGTIDLGENGQNSSLFNEIAIGGGGGRGDDGGSDRLFNGADGGSGGGAGTAWNDANGALGGSGTIGQGLSGGAAYGIAGGNTAGGGGGFSVEGQNGVSGKAGDGGDGFSAIEFLGSIYPDIGDGTGFFAGGGGGGTQSSSHTHGSGGIGGGGAGAAASGAGTSGFSNTGGGAGGTSVVTGEVGASGGSGIVIIKYQAPIGQAPTITFIPTPLTVGQTGVLITGTGFGA